MTAEAVGLAETLDFKLPTANVVTVNLTDTEGEPVRGACEILGLDPLYVANEGRFVTFVPESHAERALDILRSQPRGAEAGLIGRVSAGTPGLVTLKSRLGVARVLDLLSGEQLPRIC